jgi:hypothetical protein
MNPTLEPTVISKPTETAEFMAIKKKVMADPESTKIAKGLGVALIEYASLVAHFKTTKSEPQFVTVSEENLKAKGFAPTSLKHIENFLEGEQEILVTSGATSGFSSKPRAMTPVEIASPVLPTNAALAEELKKSMRVKR